MLATEEPALELIGVTCLALGHLCSGGNSPLHSLPLMLIFQAISGSEPV